MKIPKVLKTTNKHAKAQSETNAHIVSSQDENLKPSENDGAEALLGGSARKKELEELLLVLNLMEKECVQEKLNEEKETLKDEFITLKRAMYKVLVEAKELIRSRHETQKKKGNSVEVIEKGALIKQKLNELDSQFNKMRDAYKKQLKQRGKKFSDEQLDHRFKDMQDLKDQIEETRSFFKNAAAASYEEIDLWNLTGVSSQTKKQGVAGTPQEWRDMTAEEQAVVDRWKARDQDIDRQVGEIGDAIDRLGEIAIEIGEKAEKQSKLLENLHQHADETSEELLKVDQKLREVLVLNTQKDGQRDRDKYILLLETTRRNEFCLQAAAVALASRISWIYYVCSK